MNKEIKSLNLKKYKILTLLFIFMPKHRIQIKKILKKGALRQGNTVL